MSAQRLQIGGLDMGAEAAGLGQTVFQVEIDAYASRVLRKHWTGALHLSDVREGARRETARTEAWESKPGTTLTDAVWLEGEQGRPLNPEWVEALMSFPVGFTLA